MKKSKNSNDLPKWIVYLMLVAAILYILAILFFRSPVSRQDFPPFRGR